MRRRLSSAVGLSLLCGCGGDPPAPPLPASAGKVAPTLPRLVRERTLAEWVALSQSPDPALRAQAPWALSELLADPVQLSQALLRLLGDPSPDVRYAALVAVGRAPGDLSAEVESAAVGLLGASEPGIALVARQAVAQRGARALPALGALLRDGPEAPALLAARAVGALGEKGAPAAADLLAGMGRSLSLGLDCSRALERIGPAAAPAVAAALEGAQPTLAALLLGVAARLAPKAPAILPAIVGALERSEDDVLQAAEAAVLAVGAPALPALQELLARSSGAVAERARALAERILGEGGR